MRRTASHATHFRRSRGPVLVRLIIAVGLVTAAGGVAAQPASATPMWSVAASPSPLGPPAGNLTSVSCPTKDACFAVGSYGPDTPLKTLVERWNGTHWSLVTSPNPAGATNSFLNGVSCPTTTSCFAVGSYVTASSFQKTLVERWNGTNWSIMTSPNPTDQDDNVLNAVSCPSTTSCFAVGGYTTFPKHFVEHWNGTSWSIVATPSPPDTTNSSLSGVSCPSTTSCYAVGQYFNGSTTDTMLIEHWNGTSWAIMTSPNPADLADSAVLTGVSCPTATRCVAVGIYFNGSSYEALAEHFDGTNWFVVSAPNPAGANDIFLDAVSCLSTTRCYAVGYNTTGPPNNEESNTLTERWNGTTWSVLASPTPAGAISGVLSGVSCQPGSCYAVGTDGDTLVEHWDSTQWSTAAPPPGGSQSQLGQVSCPTTTSCYAIGGYFDGSTNKTLVERWDGTTWSVLTSPNPTGATYSVLNGVSCTTTTSCDAVGNYYDGSTLKTLVERWNGTNWAIVTSPNPISPNPSGTTNSSLSGVSCPSTTSCYAVGDYFDGFDHKTLIERWNGTSWSIVASPNGTTYSFLNGVSCPTTTNCFAVGRTGSSARTLVERWNGTSWSIVTSPSPTGDSFLNGVSCPTTTSCYAVGPYADALTDTNKTLVEHWNGNSWSMIASPTPTGATFASLNGVSCRSTTNCYAVGFSTTAPSPSTTGSTLVEHWNGTNWSIATTPNGPTSATSAALNGVSCPSTTSCYAVGDYRVNPNQYTLVERYS
jgi:hypothetical protein